MTSEQAGDAGVQITREDWAELYYGLDAKIFGIMDQSTPETLEADAAWIEHLVRIKKLIGPDGKAAHEAVQHLKSERDKARNQAEAAENEHLNCGLDFAVYRNQIRDLHALLDLSEEDLTEARKHLDLLRKSRKKIIRERDYARGIITSIVHFNGDPELKIDWRNIPENYAAIVLTYLQAGDERAETYAEQLDQARAELAAKNAEIKLMTQLADKAENLCVEMRLELIIGHAKASHRLALLLKNNIQIFQDDAQREQYLINARQFFYEKYSHPSVLYMVVRDVKRGADLLARHAAELAAKDAEIANGNQGIDIMHVSMSRTLEIHAAALEAIEQRAKKAEHERDLAFKVLRILRLELAAKDTEIGRLRGALGYYAAPEIYRQDLESESFDGRPILDDSGKIAHNALTLEEQEFLYEGDQS